MTESQTEGKKYIHCRKGEMIGKIVKEDGEWVVFEFTQDQKIKYSGGWEYVYKGDTLTVRKEFLKEQL